MLAECWGLFFSLQMVKKLGLKKVLVEMDLNIVVNWINNNVDLDHPPCGGVSSCKELFESNPGLSIKRNFRNCNKQADFVAN